MIYARWYISVDCFHLTFQEGMSASEAFHYHETQFSYTTGRPQNVSFTA